MAKRPNPEVQKRNIREAWQKLNDDDRIELMIELVGPEPIKPEPYFNGSLLGAFESLADSEKIKLLDAMFMGIAKKIDLKSPLAEYVLAIADNMREIKIKLEA